MIATVSAATFTSPLTWMLGQFREKLDVRNTIRDIKLLARKHGLRFGIFAAAWELFEDGVLPLIAWKLGYPWMAPFFWIFHFEPLSYPAAFWCFRMYDRLRGREPMDPERWAKSAYSRTMLKVASHQLPLVLGLILLGVAVPGISGLLVAYGALMFMAGFFHERIWHDTNYGIVVETDMVETKRNLAKMATFRIVSISFLGMILMTLPVFPILPFLVFELAMAGVYLVIEGCWSRSAYGIDFRRDCPGTVQKGT